MKPASRKAKGRAAQQRVRDVLRSAFPELEPGDIESRGMGQSGADLVMSPAAQRLLGIAVECKATRGQPTMATFKQAKANTPEGHLPVVTWKPYGVGHDQMVVLLSLEDFAVLLRQARMGDPGNGNRDAGG